MANKKRRRRPQRPAGSAQGGRNAPAGEARSAPAGRPQQQQRPRADRQARKEQARAQRDAALRAQRRRETIRRFLASAVVAVVVVGVFLYLTRVGGPRPFPAAASQAASAAGCSGIQTPADSAPGGQHLASGASTTYPSEPATSGLHDPSPLPADPAVYTEMPPETRLVHNLEHGFVNMYYRASGDGALASDVVDALTSYAQNPETGHVLLTPHTSLPSGTALALTYWNRILTCPSGVTAEQARTIASGFVEAFECSNVAPEASNC
jgi:hypothetical protein